VNLLGTADFTHPDWLRELKSKLEESEYGIFKHKDIYYMLTCEVSNIYFKAGRTRKIHNIIFAPSFETADEINKLLTQYGKLYSDGRPILSLEPDKMVKGLSKINKDIFVVPAHVWTPHFGLFGANSGFDSIEECFEDQTEKIYSLETGLSSDPAMNWRWSDLDRFSLISNSDAHCVHPDTNIYTISGKPVAIKNLSPTKVLSVDLAGDLKQKKARIAKLHKLPSPSILYKIVTRTKEIVTTSEHRFFVLENEKIVERKALELKKSDLVACLRQIWDKGKSIKLPYFAIDHKVKILPEGIDYLKALRIKANKTQAEIGKYIGVKEDCVWIFEKHKVKTPKESFIDKYCEHVGIDKYKVKKEFVVHRFPLDKYPEFTSEKSCQILGYVLGDGGIERSIEKRKSLSLTDKNSSLLTHYQDLIKDTFNIEGRLRKKKGNSNSVRYPAYIAEYFQKIAPEILVPSPQREVPQFIFSLPNNEIAAFLGGFFDAEGTNGRHFVQFSSSNSVLLRQIQVLLLRFGLQSYIYSDFEKDKKKWRYKLTIYSQKQLKKFDKEIKFSCSIKKEKLKKYLFSMSQNPKSCFADSLPIKSEILKIKKELAVSCYDIPKRLYYHLGRNNTLKRENVAEFIEIFSNQFTEMSPQKILIMDKLKKFAKSDIIWENIKEVKRMESDCRFVYDLTVPIYENYVANGFITHNSPSKIGREANVFKEKFAYRELIEILKTKNKEKFLYTIEFYPQEGKYHWDGHRKCDINIPPEETKNTNYRCPKCGAKITVGVMHRVEKLGDRKEDFVLDSAPSCKHMVPLIEIISSALKVGSGSQAAERQYGLLVNKFGSEFKLLLEAPDKQVESECPPKIAGGILNVRRGNVEIIPGSDGVYGKVNVCKGAEKTKEKQLELF